MSQYVAVASLLLAMYVLTTSHVEGQLKSCYFGPPPQPDPNHPDPHQWMKEAMKEIRKNCPGQPDPCKRNPCQNGGTCQVDGRSFSCNCTKGFLGNLCENQDPCLSNPCQNNGNCTARELGLAVYCSCPVELVGATCDIDNPCNSNPCQHEGTCQPVNNGANFTLHCTCPLAAFGHHCEYLARLVGGNVAYEGRVEVYYQGQWGTVCDDGWYGNEATVFCRQLGYSSALLHWRNAFFGQGSGPILLDNIDCTGSESNIYECGHSGWKVNNCYHNEDAGVTCGNLTMPVEVRLAAGNTPHEGRVEVYVQGHWGTLCDNDWDLNAATVICRQLGYSAATHAWPTAFFGEGSVPTIYLGVECTGSESNIYECGGNGWTWNWCDHYYEAGVVCASCQAYKEAGATLSFDYSFKPPCDPSTLPVKVWCNQGSDGGGWTRLYKVKNTYCGIEHNWTSKKIICPEHRPITAIRVSTSGNTWILDINSCNSLTFNADFMLDVVHCQNPSTSGWPWGNTGVLIEAVCSSDGSWNGGSFSGCGESTEVNVNVSIHFETVEYGTYVMSCYNGSSWLDLSSIPTNTGGYVYLYVRN